MTESHFGSSGSSPPRRGVNTKLVYSDSAISTESFSVACWLHAHDFPVLRVERLPRECKNGRRVRFHFSREAAKYVAEYERVAEYVSALVERGRRRD